MKLRGKNISTVLVSICLRSEDPVTETRQQTTISTQLRLPCIGIPLENVHPHKAYRELVQ